MVDTQIRSRGIKDARVLKAMETIPRHLFVEEALMDQAYNDNPLPIGERQTISQPYIVALMTEALELTGKEKVLEIGTGSGYQTALLAQLADRVCSIERIASLANGPGSCSITCMPIMWRSGSGTGRTAGRKNPLLMRSWLRRAPRKFRPSWWNSLPLAAG